MRALLIASVLALSGTVAAQSGPLPDEAACARLVAPESRPLSGPLLGAVRATVGSYAAEVRRSRFSSVELTGIRTRFSGAYPSAADFAAFRRLERELPPYLGRLLRDYGWPADPVLRADLAVLLPTPELQYCAGQAALRLASGPEERLAAARLVDRALLSVQGRQRYGTVLSLWGRTLQPDAIADAASVDARRGSIGLPALAEAIRAAQATLPARPTPPGLSRPVRLAPVCEAYTTEAALNAPLTAAQIDALLDEVGPLVQRDQDTRTERADVGSMMAADNASRAWLERTVRRVGWPSANRAGVQLAGMAWLLVQHADVDTALQGCLLDLLIQQRSTETEARNFAYLTDRVRVNTARPQVYGTQVEVTFDGIKKQAVPKPMVDPARVNERRASVGLEPIEDYLKLFVTP